MQNLTAEEKRQLLELLAEKEKRERENAIAKYKPYKKQKEFHAASKSSNQRLFMAGNRVGKSFCGAAEMSYHLTGEYPDWWEGVKYKQPITAIAGGLSNEKTRDIVQSALLGPSVDKTAYGTGSIPKRCIVSTARKAGIPDAISSAVIKHKSGGNSIISFLSYESGKQAWMGTSTSVVWLDEEPPRDIYNQALRGTLDCSGHIYMTFTPENGITDVVAQFTTDLKDGQYLVNATWDDAPHLTQQAREQILAALPPHEREMRSKGIPVIGSGLVFPVNPESISIEPIKIPSHWRRVAGIDFGFDHPTAWVSIAYDPEGDVLYVVDAYAISGHTIPMIVSTIKAKGGDKYPTAWPHDGMKHDIGSGKTYRDMYAEEGMRMLREKFTNPPAYGEEEGKGGNGVEAGVQFILNRMETGRFKVFSHLTEWFKELAMYHRKDGKIVAKRDDLLSATRYAALSLRFAICLGEDYGSYIPKETEYADMKVAY